jgi:hypothetical protein
MDDDIKKDIKRITRKTELKVTQSLLRWKYKKEGKPVPDENAISQQSETVADQAHEIIARRGKTIWNELKKVYAKKTGDRGESED